MPHPRLANPCPPPPTPPQGLINEALDDAWVDEDDPAMHVEGAEQRMFLGCKFAWLTSLPYLASLHLMGIQKVPKVLQRLQQAAQEAAQETLRTGGHRLTAHMCCVCLRAACCMYLIRLCLRQRHRTALASCNMERCHSMSSSAPSCVA